MLGQNNADLNFFLERVSAVIIIQSLCLLIVLFFYLVSEVRRRGVPWLKTFAGMPLGMGLALAMTTQETGAFVLRVAVYVWRRSGHAEAGVAMNYPEHIALLIGTVLGCAGVLGLTLVLSRPLFGHWPWLVSVSLIAAYLAQAYLLHYL
jgi:hypothetical protein